MESRTLFEKLWQAHVVRQDPAGPSLLYIDRHLVHEVTSPQAFEGLRDESRKLWRSETAIASVDHNVPTTSRSVPISDKIAETQIKTLNVNCKDFDILKFGLTDPRQGILHVVAPEQGATLPGMTIVCGDSHTSTHGAFAALAWGIGTSDVEHALATQCLWIKKPKTMQVRIEGNLGAGVSAKDLALDVIRRIGSAGGTGYAIEFSGATVSRLSMEGRMTLCNMAIEAGARFGLIAVDEKTLAYLSGRPFSPVGPEWEKATRFWRSLVSDPGAKFDRVTEIDVSNLAPLVTWGTSPDMVVEVNGRIPDPMTEANSVRRDSLRNAIEYMGLEPNMAIGDILIDKVFIGSCTNARIEDLRLAAEVVQNRRIAANIALALVVPGSGLVKRQAESEGLDRIFIDAGFEWREPGCSMCLGMNEDRLSPGERCASTSNRNFEGRQGPGGRSHLVSPQMAAAAAISGRFVDVRDFLNRG